MCKFVIPAVYDDPESRSIHENVQLGYLGYLE